MAANVPNRKAFTETLLEMAKIDKQIIAITSDARGSVTLTDFAKTLPEQFVECGIAEQNSVGIAAGLASWGKKPYVCAPACFLSARSLEQIKIDVAYSNLNVKIFGVSGGISYGALGMSHHSLHDIAVMRAIPNMTIILPCDQWQTREMAKQLPSHPGPVYIRVGRNPVNDVYGEKRTPFDIGKANMLCDGNDIAIIATGEMVYHALDAAKRLGKNAIKARVIDMHTLKPLDEETVIKAAKETSLIVTLEEHSIYGGLGAAVTQCASENSPVPVKILGIPDEPVVAGTSQEVFDYYGLTGEKVALKITKFLNEEK